MTTLLQKISNPLKKRIPKYCIACGVRILKNKCKCSSGPKVWVLPIPNEWEEYFWLDPTVKGTVIDLTSKANKL